MSASDVIVGTILVLFFSSVVFGLAVAMSLSMNDRYDDEDDAVAACMRRHVFLMAIAWPITAPWLLIRAVRAFFRDYRETVAQEEAKRAKALVKAAARAMREADEALRRAGEQK